VEINTEAVLASILRARIATTGTRRFTELPSALEP
jgi:hypothetical protein